MKKKIAIVIDKEGWAYDLSAKQIKKNISQYDVDIIPMDIFEDNFVKMLLLSEKYDLMFVMWRGLISWLQSDYSKEYIKYLGFDYEEFLDKYLRSGKIVTGVYDHLFLNSEKERTEFICNNVKYIVCSKKLYDIYCNLKDVKKPAMIVPDGVDLKKFYMQNTEKYKNIENRKIIIGWCGNSKFADEEDDDLKGLNKIIKPAVNELIEEGCNIELDIADRNIKKIEHDDMPDYYNKIDVYICASRTEGNPSPVLESMACGIPVISTDVGIVSEVFGKKQKQFIIKRDKDVLKKKIKELIDNKKLFEELSKENLEQIKKRDWKDQVKIFEEFFDKCLN